MIIAPPVTPEQLYNQDTRRRQWDKANRCRGRVYTGEWIETGWYEASNPPEDKELSGRRMGMVRSADWG